MKKVFIMLLISLLMLIGCNFMEPALNFTFKGLKVDLSNATGLGIIKNSSIKRNLSTNIEAEGSQLAIIDNKGDIVIAEYQDQEGKSIEVPFNLYSIDVFGDFTYLVYYYGNEMLEVLNYTTSINVNHGTSANEKGSNFEKLAYQLTGGAYENKVKFIILHNDTGKIFDFVDILELNPNDGGQGFVYLLNTYDDRIYYFAYYYSSDNSVSVTTGCNGELTFDSSTQNINKVESCTAIGYRGIYTNSSGNFLYRNNDKIFYSSQDLSLYKEVGSYFPQSIYSLWNLVKSVGSDTTLLTPNGFITFDENYQVLDAVEISIPELYYLADSTWIGEMNGFDYFTGETNLFYVNYDTKVYGQIDLKGEYRYYLFNDKLYLIGENLLRFDFVTQSIILLDENISYLGDDLLSSLDSGYVTYSKAEGFTKVNKSLNMENGVIYTQDQIKPTINTTQFKPIN